MKEQNNPKEIGYVKSIKSYLIHIEGLPSVKVNDLIVGEDGSEAIVHSLGEDKVYALLVNIKKPIPKQSFRLSDKGFNIEIGDQLFGRVINALGQPIDGEGELKSNKSLPIRFDVVAPGIDNREEITHQLETGITIVDTLLPMGRGQRELVFGEPRAGKTTFLLDTLKNQHDKGTICIYTLIGKDKKEVKEIVSRLDSNKALSNTIVLAATVRDGAPLISLIPDTAFTIADHFRAQGKDVLLILDDLGAHAKYLREVSLLSQTLPGREAYPGDIFYQQAHLMERAGNFNKKAGSGSITLLPVIETDLENFSALIPTNLMASTDGHLLFSGPLRAEGHYPAIDINDSVTRVGRKTQHPLLKELSDKIRPILAEYETLKSYGMFGAELGERTQEGLRIGNITREILKQEPGQHLSITVQILLLSLLFTKFMKNKNAPLIEHNKNNLITELTQDTYTNLVTKQRKTTLETLIKELDKRSADLNAVVRK